MTTKKLVVVGAGMVAQRLVEALIERDGTNAWSIDVFGDEAHRPYDRVALTSFFKLESHTDLYLGESSLWESAGVTLHTNARVDSVDSAARTVTCGDATHDYDALVLATGAYAFVPPVQGHDLRGSFVYRTLEDVAAIRDWVTIRSEELGRPLRGAVIGGGLLGLEAAGALCELDVQASVIEFADRLMPLQVDEGGGSALKRLIEKLGVTVLTSTATSKIIANDQGVVSSMEFASGDVTDVDVVIFATGVRPRDELAASAGISTHPRGGIVTDAQCRTSDSEIYAIGESACIEDKVWGLVGPGYTMAEVVADQLLGGDAAFADGDESTKLKLLGVDVASFGDAFGATEGSLDVVFADPVAGVYKKLVVSDDASTLLGGVLVGDASAYASLRPMVGLELGGDPSAWLVPGDLEPPSSGSLPDAATVCSCNNVTAGDIRTAICEQECTDLGSLKECTKAGTACGSCVPLVKSILDTELTAAGITVDNSLCEHFAHTRAELFEIVRVTGLTTFSDIIEKHGTGRGCGICRPVVASVLSSLGVGHVLDGENAALQDTNDHVMANMQKDGTYSVVPRVPGGEITPEGLIIIGEIARDFDLYTKITGGQRIDMFGARIDQLPAIWKRLT
ncbi:MAG: FAD-dependent oxidoreductase, partial [Actinomycetales bacterium]|nr:FAD-dependent oxidoreductase [Actinomycetales bacterium]